MNLLPKKIEVMFNPGCEPSASFKKKANSSYRVLSPYIAKPNPLNICYLDRPLELL